MTWGVKTNKFIVLLSLLFLFTILNTTFIFASWEKVEYIDQNGSVMKFAGYIDSYVVEAGKLKGISINSSSMKYGYGGAVLMKVPKEVVEIDEVVVNDCYYYDSNGNKCFPSIYFAFDDATELNYIGNRRSDCKNSFLTSYIPKSVKKIGDFFSGSGITKIVIEDGGAVEIGNSAFYACFHLETIDIPSAVSIGDSAFLGCKISSVDLPNVTSIGNKAFKLCDKLVDIKAPSAVNVGKNAFEGDYNLQKATMPKVTEIGDEAFLSCKKLKEIELNDVIDIGRGAFKKCESIEHINLSNALRLGNEAFCDCYYLSEIDAPQAVSIGGTTFSNCVYLERVNLPKIKSIYLHEFETCLNLKDVNLKSVNHQISGSFFKNCKSSLVKMVLSSVPAISEDTFDGCTSLEEIDLSSVSEVSSSMFSDCKSLVKINISSAKEIEERMFVGFKNLKEVNILSATTLGMSAFYGCKQIEIINAPKVTSIGDLAFYDCSSLTYVDLSSATYIGNQVFEYCTNLTELNLSSLPCLSSSVFSGFTNLKKVNLASLTSIGESAFSGCINLQEIDISSLTVINGSVFWGCEKLQNINLSSVESIGNEAFWGCSNLTEVDLPSAKYIGGGAFGKCSNISYIKIPLATAINSSAFSECTNLLEVDIPMTTSIGNYAFEGCTSLTSINMPMVTSIGHSAFYNCTSLTEVSIPLVTQIGSEAFCKCSNIKKIDLQSVTDTGRKVFWGCARLRVAIIHGDTISEEEFYGASGLEEIITDSDRLIIEPMAFYNCTSLYKITLRKPGYVSSGWDIYSSANNVVYKDGDRYEDLANKSGRTSYLYAVTKRCTHETIVTDKAVAATCSKTGLTKGSHCSDCGEVIVKQEIIQKKKHSIVKDPGKAATCAQSGLTAGSHCSVCGEVIEQQVVIPKLNHNIVNDAAVAATCSKAGLTAGSHCSLCGEIFIKQETIPKTAHSIVTDPATPATCSKTGLTEGSHCSVCGEIIVKQNTIAKKSHTVVYDKGYAASHTEKGLSDGSHCSVCGEIITAQTVIPILENPFTDVKKGKYYMESVLYLLDKNVMTGFNANTFGVDSNLTREDMVTLLWKSEGKPDMKVKEKPFPDIPLGKYYTNAVAWAKQNKIVGGYATGYFGQGDDITRQDFIKIIYGFAKYKGYDTSVVSAKTYLEKADAKDVASYARESMNWGYEKGLIGQGSDLRPKENITRQDAAMIIARFLKKFDKDFYDITFNANGGTGAPGAIKKPRNTAIDLPTIIPSKTGYTFLGWSTEKNSETADYKNGDPYSADRDVTFYAVWKINTYTLSFNANKGSGAPEAITKTHGVAINLPSAKPERTGYTFQGWSTDKSSETVQYKAGATYKENANTILYAVWKINTYKISFNANKGSGAPEAITKTHGVAIKLPSSVPQRTGYSFLGWSSDKSSDKAEYRAGATYQNNTNAVLYAIWKADTYTISFNANKGGGAPEAITKTYGVSVKLPTATPERTGYTFLGWSTDKSSETVEYKAGATYKNDVGATLYAVWKINTYTISFNANGGSGAPEAITKTHGIAVNLPTGIPERTGYTFLGWSTNKSAESAGYGAGSAYKNNANVTLYAVWKIKTYTIYFNANGGVGAPERITKTHGVSVKLPTTKPERTGYTFLGWSTDKSSETAEYKAGATYKANADATLFAVWKIKTYTITFDANGGSDAPDAIIKNYDASITIPADEPQMTGYTFQGWSTDKTSKKVQYVSGDFYNSNKNIMLYAVWKLKEYNVILMMPDGASQVVKKVWNDTITIPDATYVISNNCFVGWSTDDQVSEWWRNTTPQNAEQYVNYNAGDEYSTNADLLLYAVEIPVYNFAFRQENIFYVNWPEDMIVIHGRECVFPDLDVTGFNFSGWDIDRDGIPDYVPGEKYYITGGETYYRSELKPVLEYTGKYHVVFDANGGTGGPVSITKELSSGDRVILDLSNKVPQREGYHFKGWAAYPEADDVIESFILCEYPYVYASKFYAIWDEIDTFTVTFDANGGSGGPDKLEKTEYVDTNLPEAEPSRADYKFLGWAESPTARVAKYAAGGKYTDEGDKTLYAVWDYIDTITITFDANGGSGGPESVEKKEYSTINLPLEKPSKENSSFIGWSVNGDATVVDYAPGDLFSSDFITTLYAVWDDTEVVSGTYGDNITWSLNADGCMTFSGTGTMTGTAYMLNLNGRKVKKVVVSEGITSISEMAFYNMSDLETVELPSGITSIGGQAFGNCSSLKAIDIPDTVTALGFSFAGCSKLESFTIPSSVTSISYLGVMSGLKTFTCLSTIANTDWVWNLGENQMPSLENVYLPESYKTVSISGLHAGCAITYF